MTMSQAAQGDSLTRRGVLKPPAALSLGALVLGRPGPYIGNAEAATPTLRLLMWQPYAIKETIAAFEETNQGASSRRPSSTAIPRPSTS